MHVPDLSTLKTFRADNPSFLVDLNNKSIAIHGI
jgi:hypothetical protein